MALLSPASSGNISRHHRGSSDGFGTSRTYTILRYAPCSAGIQLILAADHDRSGRATGMGPAAVASSMQALRSDGGTRNGQIYDDYRRDAGCDRNPDPESSRRAQFGNARD